MTTNDFTEHVHGIRIINKPGRNLSLVLFYLFLKTRYINNNENIFCC